MVKTQLKNLPEDTKNELYGYAKRLFDYKWQKNVSIKNKDIVYEGEMFPGLVVLQEYGFIKKVGPAKPNFKYGLEGIDWWGLVGFVYKIFAARCLDVPEMYNNEKQVDVLYEVAEKKSQKLDKELIKITQKEFSQHLDFMNIVYALREAEHRGWIEITDINILLPDLIFDKNIKFEVYLRFHERDAKYSLTLEKSGKFYIENKPEKIYPLIPDNDNYKILKYLVARQRERRFIGTDELSSEFKKPKKLIRKAVDDLRRRIKRNLGINGNEVIEGEKNKGYRINPNTCKINPKKY